MTATTLAAVDVAFAAGLDHAQAGDGRLVLLFGEAGIGKASAVRRVESKHPTLGLHLRNAVRTGTYITYDPEVPTQWRC